MLNYLNYLSDSLKIIMTANGLVPPVGGPGSEAKTINYQIINHNYNFIAAIVATKTC